MAWLLMQTEREQSNSTDYGHPKVLSLKLTELSCLGPLRMGQGEVCNCASSPAPASRAAVADTNLMP